jgi:hypothetical protein
LLADACGAAAAGLLPVLLRRQLPAGVPGLSRESLRDLLNVFAARPSAGSSSGDRRPRRLRR